MKTRGYPSQRSHEDLKRAMNCGAQELRTFIFSVLPSSRTL